MHRSASRKAFVRPGEYGFAAVLPDRFPHRNPHRGFLASRKGCEVRKVASTAIADGHLHAQQADAIGFESVRLQRKPASGVALAGEEQFACGGTSQIRRSGRGGRLHTIPKGIFPAFGTVAETVSDVVDEDLVAPGAPSVPGAGQTDALPSVTGINSPAEVSIIRV